MSGLFTAAAIIIAIVAILCSIASIALGVNLKITDRKFNLIVGGCGLMSIIVSFFAAQMLAVAEDPDAGLVIGSVLAQLLAIAGCVVMVCTDLAAVRATKEEVNRPMTYEEFQQHQAQEAQRTAAASDPAYADYLQQHNQDMR